MVQIPTFTNEIAVPGPKTVLADPGAAGLVGNALARGGEALSDEMQAFNARYADARRQADASNIVAGISKKLGDAQFRWSQTADRQAAMDGFGQEADALRKETLAGIGDPLVSSYVSRQFDQEAISRSLETGNTAFQLESSKRRGDLDSNLASFAQSAATAGTEPLRAQMIDNGVASIKGAVAAGWLNPEAGAKSELAFQSQIQELGVRRALNGILAKDDPDAAYALAGSLNDPAQFPGLSPEKRETLTKQIEDSGDRMTARAAAAATRIDAQAQRNLTRSQAYNAAQLVVSARAGTLDEKQLPELVRSQAISESGYAAIVTALDREEKGRDDPATAGALRAAVESGHAGSEDINGAFAAGKISTTTYSAMMTKWGEREKQNADQIERGAFQTLKSITSGNAVEQGLIKDDTLRAHAEQIWSQALGEWNRRVLVNKEDPVAVLSDIGPKYALSMPQNPSWLAPPKFGAVRSLDDVKNVYGKTKSAYDAKQLSAADFDGEARLLDNYRAFYAEKQNRETVIPMKPGAKPPAAKPGAKEP